MKLIKFRIENFRSIQDSGWIEIDDTAVIVGKNESGKTSLLKALWKFNPFKKETYNISKEWPKGRRKEISDEKNVVTAIFEFNEHEKNKLAEIHESAKDITSVEIKKNYKGSFTYDFFPRNPEQEHSLKWVVSVIDENFGTAPENSSPQFKERYNNHLTNFVEQVRKNGGSIYALNNANSFKSVLSQFVNQNPQDQDAVNFLTQNVDKAIQELGIHTPLRQSVDMVHEWLPVFIYMDDYKTFQGSALLNQVKQRKDSNQLTEADKTIIMIMEMSGLSLDEEVKKGTQEDKEQRMLDMHDASQTLTNEIADTWSQKKYEVMFQADGQHFVTFVKDAEAKALVPLEDRSKGFQWFFSFDMTFMYETNGQFKNAIILLDEPGLHLHAAAQKDLLARFRAYSKNNQLIYTTHLPFMIDFTRLDNIYVAEEKENEGSKVHKDWVIAEKDARFTLQAALGLSWSQSLFVGQYNLIVEGVTDFWFLTTMSSLFQESGREGLDEQLIITPAGGASKVAYIGTIFRGQELNVAVLLDSDNEGKSAYEQLVYQWLIESKYVFMLGEIIGIDYPCVLEDLFSEEYYLQHVNAAYQHELGKEKTITLNTGVKRTIVDRVADALLAEGMTHFNKGRVAKKIMNDLGKKKLSDLPQETIDKFEKTFGTINQIVQQWKERK